MIIDADLGNFLIFRISEDSEPVGYQFAPEEGFSEVEKSGLYLLQGEEPKTKRYVEPTNQLECAQCGKNFKSAYCLKVHVQQHEMPKEKLTCKLCGYHLRTRSSFGKHLKVHCDKESRCPVCDEQCRTKADVRKHLYTQHDMIEAGYICELCGKSYSDYRLYWKHTRTHSNARPYECDFCAKKFKSKKHLKRHLQIHGVFNEDNKFICSICNKAMVKREYFEAHIKQHAGEFGFECKDCHRGFSSKMGLNIHRANKQAGNCTSNPRCDVCQREFAKNENICEHIERRAAKAPKAKYVPRNMREKTKPCPVCGKMFLYNSEVKLHVVVSHSDEKRFVCEECGKCFKTQKCFNLHKRIHLNCRPYPCRFCQKSFRTLNHIKQHIRTHTGEKPYLCPVCDRGFAQSGDMKKHLVKIHNLTVEKFKE